MRKPFIFSSLLRQYPTSPKLDLVRKLGSQKLHYASRFRHVQPQPRASNFGVRDERVNDNGTESDLLIRSFQRAVLSDVPGK